MQTPGVRHRQLGHLLQPGSLAQADHIRPIFEPLVIVFRDTKSIVRSTALYLAPSLGLPPAKVVRHFGSVSVASGSLL
jgi:hypothetical protein